MGRIADKSRAARESGVFIGLVALILSLIGCLLVLSVTATRHMASLTGEPWYHTVSRQGMWVGIAGIAAIVLSRIDYHRLVARAYSLLFVVWIGLAAVLVFGSVQYGARRWIDLGPGYLQVSEFAKIAVILASAHHVTSKGPLVTSYVRGFLPAMGWLAVTCGLIAVEPDFGTTMFIVALSMLLLYLGGLKIAHILPTVACVLPFFVWFMIEKYAHVSKRLTSFSEGKMSHIDQALTVMGAGGLLGVGPGEGRAQLDFVNMVRNDFIFSAVGEQYGFAGSLLILALFMLLLWHGLRVTMFARDTAGFLVAFGLTFMIVFQAAINMMVVTGLVPPKGIGLPFISYGGSSILMFGCAIGILMNVSRQGGEALETAMSEEDEPEGVEPMRLDAPGDDVDIAENWDEDLIGATRA